MRKIRYWTLSTSTLPVGDVTDFDMMGYSQSKLTVDLCVNVGSCAPDAYCAAPVAARPCSTPPGGARQDLTIGYVLQSTGVESLVLLRFYRGVSSFIAVHRTFVSGCEGPHCGIV